MPLPVLTPASAVAAGALTRNPQRKPCKDYSCAECAEGLLNDAAWHVRHGDLRAESPVWKYREKFPELSTARLAELRVDFMKRVGATPQGDAVYTAPAPDRNSDPLDVLNAIPAATMAELTAETRRAQAAESVGNPMPSPLAAALFCMGVALTLMGLMEWTHGDRWFGGTMLAAVVLIALMLCGKPEGGAR